MTPPMQPRLAHRIRETLAGIAEEGRALGAVEAVIPGIEEAVEQSERREHEGALLGPLDGVPFAVKANIDVRGVPTTSGLAGVATTPASDDAHAVHLLRQAGAIPVATATMAPLAIGAVTEHPVIGPCRNPHDRDRQAGGSSGGSGALVGAGLVPFALGSDTMGSVRIPAAYCQVLAWLPSHGSVSPRGLVPLAEPMDSIGVIAADALVLSQVAQCLRAPDLHEPWWHAVTPPESPTPLRVATCDLTARADATGRHAIDDLQNAMVEQGARFSGRIDFESQGIDPAAIRRRGLLLVETAAADRFGEEYDAGLIPEPLLPLIDYGRATSAPRLWGALRDVVDLRRKIRLALSETDVVILPTTPMPAPLLGEDPTGAADLTAWVYIAGLPAVVIPWAGSSVQLVGHPGSDDLLLHWARRLTSPEQAA